MPKLKLMLDKIEEVDETVRSLYVEKNGKYYLDLENYEDAATMADSLRKERVSRRDLDKKLRTFRERLKKIGLDPEEVDELDDDTLAETFAVVNKKETPSPKPNDGATITKAEHETLLAGVKKTVEKDLQKANDRAAALQRALESQVIETAALQAIGSAKGTPKLLMPHIRSTVKVIEEDGKFEVRVLDEKGEPREKGGKWMGVADLVEEMRNSEDFSRAFDATNNGGGGAPPGGGGGAPVGWPTKKGEFKSTQQKLDYIAKFGGAAYEKLPV